MKKTIPWGFLALSCVISPISWADLIINSDYFNSTEQLGGYQAQASWENDALSIQLTNLSPPDNGGYITGFLMKLPEGVSFSGSNTTTQLDFLNPDSGPYNGAPFGDWDYGYALKGHFLGGGKPSKGIEVDGQGQFNFMNFQGLPADMHDSENILNYLFADLEAPEAGHANFLVRFRGFEDGGSDKVPGRYDPPADGPPALPPGEEPPNIEIPVPSSIILMITGLLGLMCLRRKRF